MRVLHVYYFYTYTRNVYTQTDKEGKKLSFMRYMYVQDHRHYIDGYQSYHHVTVVPPPPPCAVLYLILTASCVTLVPL